MLRWLASLHLIFMAGCSLVPDPSHEPTVHNPFPQLSKVAVAPFFNLSDEPTVDTRQFAAAYYNELQSVPGFEVVPVGVVEQVMRQQNLSLNNPEDARRLAQVLGVDAVVIGAVTDFSMYRPPRCGLTVEWYGANPCFHPIPPGYGLPWGTPAEAEIPEPLIFEAEMALAKAQMATQTPSYQPLPVEPPAAEPKPLEPVEPDAGRSRGEGRVIRPAADWQMPAVISPKTASGDAAATIDPAGADRPVVPEGWPDPRGFVPPPPSCRAPACQPSGAPVLKHTRIYQGNDPDFTAALETYEYFRDDGRYGGWQAYLMRSDDFIRFCCRKHIWEMLSARGGAGETRVVWRWPTVR